LNVADVDSLEKEVVSLGREVSRLDKDVAVVKAEISGLHTEMKSIHKNVEQVSVLAQENKVILTDIKGKASGAIWILGAVNVVVGVVVVVMEWVGKVGSAG